MSCVQVTDSVQADNEAEKLNYIKDKPFERT